jgi:hypothetical protein
MSTYMGAAGVVMNMQESVDTSGCPWPKATLKSPVGARDLGPL